MNIVSFAKKAHRKLDAVTKQAIRSSMNLIDNPAIVLMYHRVTDIDKDPYQLAVKPEIFIRQIEQLKKFYTILSPDDFAEIVIKGKKFPKNCVVITFDDGYADNFLEALPILESFDAPALFYVCTDFLDSDKEKWDEQLTQIFLDDNKLPAELEISLNENKKVFDTSSLEKQAQTCNQLYQVLLHFSPPCRKEIISQLFNWANLSTKARSQNRAMTCDELKKMSQSKYTTIGAHTHNHSKLSSLGFEDQFLEIEKSKKILEKITSKKITYFAYPFGTKADYNKNSIKILKHLGFNLGVSLFYGQVHSWTNKFEVPRMLTGNWKENEFSHKISEYFKC